MYEFIKQNELKYISWYEIAEAKKFAKVWRTHKAVNLEEEDTQKSESDQKVV